MKAALLGRKGTVNPNIAVNNSEYEYTWYISNKVFISIYLFSVVPAYLLQVHSVSCNIFRNFNSN